MTSLQGAWTRWKPLTRYRGVQGSEPPSYAIVWVTGSCEDARAQVPLRTLRASQVQTNPTLLGYIEGAPPIASENYVSKSGPTPAASIRFSQADRSVLTYSARGEQGHDSLVTKAGSAGLKWSTSFGLGVSTVATEGMAKLSYKLITDATKSDINNAMTSFTDTSQYETRMELTGGWHNDVYEANNVGVALVQSETCDLYALRLKRHPHRGPAPLIAYQLRPNPTIPKDTNLMTFRMNDQYVKAGCLDGKRGLRPDAAYPAGMARDVSYYKPKEAYALKDRIRREQERMQEEWRLRQMAPSEAQASTSTMAELMDAFPKRQSRSICNSYDALDTVHYTLTQTKSRTAEKTFELLTDLPGPIEIRERTPLGEWKRRAGAVDTYRWMSYWLEPSTESMDFFFRRVVDPQWLSAGKDANAVAFASLKTAQESQGETAKQKCWRVLHRVTFVSRVPEDVAASPQAPPSAQAAAAASTPAFEVNGNWRLLQELGPLVQASKDRVELVTRVRRYLGQRSPSMLRDLGALQKLVEFLCDYFGVPP
ncbi:unnamed protein product [Parajaminaea phylloscopi]